MSLGQQDIGINTPRHGTYSKAYPQAQWNKPSRPHAASCLVLLAGIMLAAAVAGRLLLARPAVQDVRYALVIDSGSSGTRMYAYNWTQPQPGVSSLPVVQLIPPSAAPHLVPKHARKGMYNRVETRPGLDVFAANASGLTGALDPLLAWARAVVPAKQHSSTPLFLMATGGLRRLPAAQQTSLLADIRQQLAHSGFRFEPEWARVISGDDEGAFVWLALNYQQGRLRPHRPQPAAAPSRAAAKAPTDTSITSLGALDLGGSSLQITFEVPPPITASSKGTTVPPGYNISVSGHTFHLHLHSFKQYGLNEAFDRAVTVLLQQQVQQQPSTDQQQQSGVQLARVGDEVPSSASTEADSSGSSSNVTAHLSNISSIQQASKDASLASEAARWVPAAGALVAHDIAVAEAAGVHADPAAAAAVEGPQHLNLEHQRQADLAAAAAAGYHPHDVPNSVTEHPASSSIRDGTQDLSSASTAAGGQSTGGTHNSSSIDLHSGSSSGSSGSSSMLGSSSHGGLQPRPDINQPTVQSTNSGASSDGAVHASTGPVLKPDISSGLVSPSGLRLQDSAGHAPAAVRRRTSGALRRSLLQQQLQWVEQLLTSPQQGTLTTAGSGATGCWGSSSTAAGCTHQQQQQQQYSHDVRLRQLLREYLIRDPVVPPGAGDSSSTANSSSTAAGIINTAPAVAAPHDVVPIDAGGSSSSSGGAAPGPPAAAIDQQQGPAVINDSSVATAYHAPALPSTSNSNVTLTPSSSDSSSSKLPVVLHPCLHRGFEAVYDRVAYGGVTPQPPQVVLRGQPNWDACLRVVDAVVNVSAPCAEQDHRPSCVLGAPQPELQGNFMGLTGFYVVSRFLGVRADQTLGPLLDAATALCSRDWSWVQRNFGSHVNVERYCTWGPYVAKLLLHGLGLEEHQVMMAQDGDLGWPLGAVLVEASKLPGFSTGHAAAAGAKTPRSKTWQTHRKSALGGTGAVGPPSMDASAPVEQHLATVVAVSSPKDSLQQHEAQPTAHGPSWPLGLLHQRQAGFGLQLGTAGWVVVLGLVWLMVVCWYRGVCGPKAPGGPVFLPVVMPAGPGRAHVSSFGGGRTKATAGRTSFKAGK